MSAQKGFTLIELVLVIVIVAVASVPLFGLFTQASSSMLSNEAIQTAAQLAQERVELVLGVRRKQGFDAIATGTTNEGLTGSFAGFNRSTSVTQPLTPPAGCPAGASCKLVVVTVDRGAAALAQVPMVLIDY
jgi:prepilin-type N-terminal cleavage/methylation domain-containing protein